MDERKRTNKTLAERLHNANVLPDGNLNSVNTFDVVLMDLGNGEIDRTDEATTSSAESASE